MTPEAGSVPDSGQEQMGAFARITGVFFEPGKTFADIGRRPTWFLPLLLCIVASLAFFTVYGQRVGWEQFVQQQAAMSPRAAERIGRLTPEQREIQARFIGIGFYFMAVVGFPVILLISSSILLGMTAMMSAGLRFKQVFAVVCFAGLPMAIKQLLSIPVAYLKNPEDFNVQNPLAFNFAAFMDPSTSSKFLYTYATSFDVFAIWVIVLTAVGLSAAAGKRKLSFGSALLATATPWVVLVTLAATSAAIFS